MSDQVEYINQSKDIKELKEIKEVKENKEYKDSKHHKKHKKQERSRSRSHHKNKDRHDNHKSVQKSSSRQRSIKEEKSKKSQHNNKRDNNHHHHDHHHRKSRKYSSSYSSQSPKHNSSQNQSKNINNINKRQAFKFDSPPKDHVSYATQEHAKQIIENNGQIKQLLNQVKDVPTQDIIQQFQMLQTFHQASKSNLPLNQTPLSLCSFINSALKKMNINQNTPGDSCISAWISPDGTYAFVEFRSSEEANNAFQLNNVVILGKQLKVGRPRTYTSSQQMNNISPSMMFPGMGNVMNYFNSLLTNPMSQINLNPLSEITKDNHELLLQDQTIKVQTPTNVLVLKNMVQLHELDIDEEFQEIYEDIKEQCQNYGQVIDIKIPRPIENTVVVGLGKVFVQFATVEEAKECKKQIQGLTFAGKSVEVSFFCNQKFLDGNLEE